MAIQLSPLVHMEVVVRDAEAAYRFLHEAFGAEKVQEEFAGFLDTEAMRVIHVGLGDLVLQFIQPMDPPQPNSWQTQLSEKGPGVHNLTFLVDSMAATLAALDAEGVTPVTRFPLEWERLIPPGQLKEDPSPVYMMDTMDRIGFHLELAESPLREPPPPAPALGERVGRVSPLLHVELVTADADATHGFLSRVFGSERVEMKFASFLDSPFMKIVHVNLSDVVLQYCQPLIGQGSWYEQLEQQGPGVHNITFLVDDMAATMQAIRKAGAEDLFTFELQWGDLLGSANARPDVPPVHMVNTRDLLGFHLELSESPALGKFDILFKDVA